MELFVSGKKCTKVLDLGAPRNSGLLPALPRSEKQQPVPKTHQSDVTPYVGLTNFPKTQRKMLGALWESVTQ